MSFIFRDLVRVTNNGQYYPHRDDFARKHLNSSKWQPNSPPVNGEIYQIIAIETINFKDILGIQDLDTLQEFIIHENGVELATASIFAGAPTYKGQPITPPVPVGILAPLPTPIGVAPVLPVGVPFIPPTSPIPPTKTDLSDKYPHTCPKCKAPSYNSTFFNNIDCSANCQDKE